MTPGPSAGGHYAILVAHWEVHSSVGYIASWLEQAGCSVDLYLHDADGSLSGGLVRPSKAVRVFQAREADASPAGRAASKRVMPGPLWKTARWVRDWLRLRLKGARGLIGPELIQRVVEQHCLRPYDVLLGVEKGGLAWAAEVAGQTGAPLVYYSLELYNWDHPWVTGSMRQRRFKIGESQFLKRCRLVVIQDEHRGRVLLEDNGVKHPVPMAYLPVAVSGPAETGRERWFHDHLGLPADTAVILSYGMMTRQRPCVDLAEAAAQFPPDWCLVMHGHGDPDILAELEGAHHNGRMRISTDLVPVEQRGRLVRSADVGLALYYGHMVNDRLTGKSSEKIALYLQGGVPVIGFRHPSYEHLEAEGAGVLIDRLEELPAAVARILSERERFAANARACYERYYRFEHNFERVYAQLVELAREVQTARAVA